MKKIIAGLLMVSAMLLGSMFYFTENVEAADVRVYDGYYIVKETVVYGNKTSYYAKANIKHVAKDGTLINNSRYEFGRDEGDFWFGVENTRGSLRAYDYGYSTAIINWLIEHRGEAHPIGNGMQLVF